MSVAPSAQSRTIGTPFILALCTAVGIVLVIRPYQWMNDDAYFYLKVALNHSRGLGSTFSGLAPTNGYHPLWQWMLFGLFDVLKPGVESGLIAARLLCWAVMTAALMAYLRFACRVFGNPWGAASAALLSIFATRGVSCMEFWLQGLLIVLVLMRVREWGDVDRVRPTGAAVGDGLLLAMLVLCRLDTMVFVAWVLVMLVMRDRQTSGRGAVATRMTGAIVILSIVAYAFCNAHTFGHAASISSLLKSSFPHPVLPTFTTLLSTKHAWPGWLAAGVLVFLPARAGERTPNHQIVRLLSASTLLHAALVLSFTRWPAFGIWYWMLSYLSLAMFVSELGRRWMNASWATLAVILAALWNTMAIADALVRYPDRPEGEMGRQVAAHLPNDAIVFQVDATGMTSYLSDRTIINGDGLMNNMEYQDALHGGRLQAYLAKYGVTHIVHDEVEAMGADVASGNYRVARYDVPCHLKGTATTLELGHDDEIARWTVAWPGQLFPWPRDGHRQTFVVWQRSNR
ncbi:MAG: hypothetical protein AABZ08_08465 [Planctomycetota bacterium]